MSLCQQLLPGLAGLERGESVENPPLCPSGCGFIDPRRAPGGFSSFIPAFATSRPSDIGVRGLSLAGPVQSFEMGGNLSLKSGCWQKSSPFCQLIRAAADPEL